MDTIPFQDDSVDLLAQSIRQVHAQAMAQGDIIKRLVDDVRRATSEHFDIGRLLHPDDAVRRWVQDYTREQIAAVRQAARAKGLPEPTRSDEEIVSYVLDQVLGLGPLESLRQMDGVEDIAINGPDEVYVFRYGRWERTVTAFEGGEEGLLSLLNRAIAPTGRQVSRLRPIVDAVLPDGSRINIVSEPCAMPNPCACIRVRRESKLSFLDLVTVRQTRQGNRQQMQVPDYTRVAREGAMLNAQVATFLHMAVLAGLNIMVVGPTGVGKTTLLSALGGLIPADRRILVIEDTRELRMRETEDGSPGNCVYFLTRERGLEGTEAITQAHLVRAALRQRPDALTVGEARGGEILDMLKALGTGHRNGLTSLHAETVEEVPTRIRMMLQEAELRMPLTPEAVATLIANAFHLVIALGIEDGQRYVREILEFTGRVEGSQPMRQVLFRWDPYQERLVRTGMRMEREALLERAGFSYQTIIEMDHLVGGGGGWR